MESTMILGIDAQLIMDFNITLEITEFIVQVCYQTLDLRKLRTPENKIAQQGNQRL